MSRRTYLPLLMDRWTAGTQELTFEQRGFYISLLVWMYDTGEAIKDADHAARILRCDKRTSRRLLAELSPKFRRTSAGLRHKVLDNLLRNGGRIKGLEADNFPTVPVPVPEERKTTYGSPKKVDSKTRPKSEGKSLSQDWKPQPTLLAWVTKNHPHVNVEQITQEFIDYWIAVPGQRGRKKDWDATFRNRVRQVASRNKPNGDNYDKPIRGSADWYAERDRERERKRLDAEAPGRLLEGDDGVVWEKLEN